MKFNFLHHKFFKKFLLLNSQMGLFIWVLVFGGCQFYFKAKNPTFTQYSSISYSQVHEKIFAPHCIACHGNLGGVNLESYPNVVHHLAVIGNAVFTTQSMPKNGFLAQNEKELLSTWIKEGALEFPVNPALDVLPTPIELLQPTFVSLQKNIFNIRCVLCHSPGGKAARVPLQTYDDFMQSPREIVLPGNVDESGLMIAITREDQKRMPPTEVTGPLRPKEIEIIRKWIQDGAPEGQ